MNKAEKTNNSKARSALIASFGKLMMERPYTDIHIADVLSKADVSRSTFYEHFRNKDDLLRHSICGILRWLATAGLEPDGLKNTNAVLDHFLEIESLVKAFFNSPVSAKITQIHAELIVWHIEQNEIKSRADGSKIPMQLLAIQVAEATIGIIRAWLNEHRTTPKTTIAQTIHESAAAILSRHFHIA